MEELIYFYPDGHEGHKEVGHPERPERVEVLRQALDERGWWKSYSHVEPVVLTKDFLQHVHTARYLDTLQIASRQGMHLDTDTYTTADSWQLALNAAGGAVAVARDVWQGHSRRGVALTRPPGHHATPGRAMGFCLLNNISLAAEDLIRNLQGETPNAQRLAIIDLDLHHGNGTQDIFWARKDVFYISTHQSPWYPGSGHLDETGGGSGEGYTANFPLPPGTGDKGFQTVMSELILPMLDEYAPEMLLVSFGFDPHWRDPLGNLMLSAEGYGALISDLVKWVDRHCDGKISLFLEGGYDLDAGAACIQAAVAALLAKNWDDPLGPSPRPEGNSWEVVVRNAREIWNL